MLFAEHQWHITGIETQVTYHQILEVLGDPVEIKLAFCMLVGQHHELIQEPQRFTWKGAWRCSLRRLFGLHLYLFFTKEKALFIHFVL